MPLLEGYKRSSRLLDGKLLQYLLPSVFTGMALSLATVVDGIIVSWLLGVKAFAAVNLCAPVVMAMNALIMLLGGGACALVGKSFGSRNLERARGYFTLCLLLSAVLSLVAAIAGNLALDPIARSLANGELEELIAAYLRNFLLGLPFILIPSVVALFMQTDAQPVLTAAFLMLANVVNLILDIVFIKGCGLGIGGSSLATVCGYITALPLLVVYARSKKRMLGFTWRELSLKKAAEIVKVGFPMALTGLLMFVKTLFLNAAAMSFFGSMGAAFMGVCLNCMSITSIFSGGIAQAMSSIVPILFGAEDLNGLKMVARKAIRLAIAFSLLFMAVLLLFPGQAALLFSVRDVGAATVVQWFAFSVPFVYLMTLLPVYYGSTMRAGMANLAGCLNHLSIIPFAYALPRIWGPSALWGGFLASSAFSIVAILLLTKVYAKRKGLSPILLLPEERGVSIDITILTNPQEAAALSERVACFLHEHGVGSRDETLVSLAVEELAMSIITYGMGEIPVSPIDVFLKRSGASIIISMRYGGKVMNPLTYTREMQRDEIQIDSLSALQAVAKRIEYSNAMGFNTLTIERPLTASAQSLSGGWVSA